MRRCLRPAAGMLLAVLAAGISRAGEEAAVPVLAGLPVEAYAEIHHQPHVLTLELRANAAIGAAMFPTALRPEAVAQADIAADCLAVLIIDETSVAEDVAGAAARFGAAGCAVRRLSGDAAGWVAAGLAGPAAPRPAVRPGDVPFIVPRGLCEPREPAQRFD